ncbi:MAG: sigma-70 family RNA polymerase sigma factor [Proteobacteria bacterium]|nr:sigma-70 family RNA polymerase sigma factor [Pseudomonadota bacterium]
MKGNRAKTGLKTTFKMNSSMVRPKRAKNRSTIPEATINRHHDPALSRYFQELAGHEILDGDSETEIAKKIADLEIVKWELIFHNPAIVCPVLEAVNRTLVTSYDEKVFMQLRPVFLSMKRKSKNTPRSARGRESYRQTSRKLAEKLHKVDNKRDLVQTAHDTVIHLDINEHRKTRKAKLADQVQSLREINRHVKASKHHFIQSNLRLVVAVARRYDRGQMPLNDLIQEGNLGLIKAVERFDYRRGFRFSTYASWWIRHAIGRALADKGHAVRVPVHALDTHHRLARAVEMIGLRLGRYPTDEELAKEAGIDERRLAKARKHPMVPVCSLDREISNSDDRRYIDLLADEEGKSPFDFTLLNVWTSEMNKVLGVLTPIEQSIISWRYGLTNGEELTLKEIGDHYHLSRERIRQLQEQALRKIRKQLSLNAA